MRRLGAATAGDPGYDRSAPPAIVHLGVGAFARAHVLTYADDLLRAGHGATVHGVSLRSARAEAALGPQDGWFTVTTREPGVPPSTRLVGSLAAVGTGAAAAVAAIASPTARLVTLTITEHGYEGEGPAVVAAAVAARRRAGGGPLVVASLDNLLDNGHVLRRRVLAAAEDDDLRAWIDGHVSFPRSVVDRMVPATTPADHADLTARLGVEDHGAVVAEAHRSWVLESPGPPLPLPFDRVGVEVVQDVEARQRRKLWLLNGPHSAVAYVGLLAGHATVAAATVDPVVTAFVAACIEDVLAVVEDPSAAGYAADAVRRFANPVLGHTCRQVGADGSRKLAQRVLPVLDRRAAAGLEVGGPLPTVVAAWLAAAAGVPVAGRVLPQVADPLAVDLRRLADDHRRLVAAALPGGGHHDVVVDALGRLAREGVAALEVGG